jgi:hypothetical protein
MSKIKKAVNFATAFALAVASTNANAQQNCPFTVSGLAVDYWGDVLATFTNTAGSYQWFLCNLQGTVTVNAGFDVSSNFTSGSCNALFAELLTARSSGSTVVLWLNGPTACTLAGGLPANGWMSPMQPEFITF